MFYVMFFDIVLFYIINAIRCDWSLWGVVIWQNLSCSWHSQVPILNSETTNFSSFWSVLNTQAHAIWTTNPESTNLMFFSQKWFAIIYISLIIRYKLIFVNKFRVCKFRIRCWTSWTLLALVSENILLMIFFYKNSQFALFWKKLVVPEFRNGCGYVVSKIIIQKIRQNTRFLFFWLCKFVILKVGGLFLRAGGYWLQFHIFFLSIWWFISFVGFIILFTQLSFYQT